MTGARFDVLAERLARRQNPDPFDPAVEGLHGGRWDVLRSRAIALARADLLAIFAGLGPSEGAKQEACKVWQFAYGDEQNPYDPVRDAIEAAWRHDLGVGEGPP